MDLGVGSCRLLPCRARLGFAPNTASRNQLLGAREFDENLADPHIEARRGRIDRQSAAAHPPCQSKDRGLGDLCAVVAVDAAGESLLGAKRVDLVDF